MKKRAFVTGALIGGLLTAPLIGLMYLANVWVGLPFAPFDVFDWVTRILPGPVVTFGIDLTIDTLLRLGVDVAATAKTAERLIAVLLFLFIGAAAGAVCFAVMKTRRVKPDRAAGLVAGALLGLPMLAVDVAIGQSPISPLIRSVWLAALFLAWGAALSWNYAQIVPGEPSVPAAPDELRSVVRLDRRRFLIRLGASTAAITVLSGSLGAILAETERRRAQAAPADTVTHPDEQNAGPLFPNANDPVVPVPGTRPEYTPLKDHYKVFIRAEPTVIDGATWVLPITGLVDNPLMLTLDDLRNNYESRDQYVTLSCISGRIGTTLIGTTLWTGVSLHKILASAKPRRDARYLYITSGDGFYETVSLDLIASDERILLCYAWDGHPLPVEHGFPLRIWIPDRYGMKQPKWITSIEVTAEYREGYWVKRRWDEVARVNATSVIDTVAVDAIVEEGGQKRVPIGGIAFAGARGISGVEVRVDGGPWRAARLRAPLSETTWVIWRYEWPFAQGQHTFEVRCADGDGTPQIEETRPVRPSGETGIHKVEIDL